MKLIVQPEDGVTPLIKAIDSATKAIDIAIFRFDRNDIQHALERAVARGVSVRALIGYKNRGPESELRKLESEFLAAGIEVARTRDDLLRYHYKFMIVDRQILYVLTFNYTYLDISATRSFGIITRNPSLLREALKLFEADIRRQAYTPEIDTFLVSPINARQELSRFIRTAKQQLLIYDPEVSDRDMIRLLRERTKAGIEIRIIGRVRKEWSNLGDSGLMQMRFHTRTIIRDRQLAFIGSQSLREAELDRRRELGLIIDGRDVVHSLVKIFESDWGKSRPRKKEAVEHTERANRPNNRVVKAVVRELPLKPLVEKAMKHALAHVRPKDLSRHKFERRLEDAVREALEQSVSHIVGEAVKAEART